MIEENDGRYCMFCESCYFYDWYRCNNEDAFKTKHMIELECLDTKTDFIIDPYAYEKCPHYNKVRDMFWL
jgi:hypothetical protein